MLIIFEIIIYLPDTSIETLVVPKQFLASQIYSPYWWVLIEIMCNTVSNNSSEVVSCVMLNINKRKTLSILISITLI